MQRGWIVCGTAPTRWLLRRPRNWRAGIRWAGLDLSGPYRAAFDTALPDARRVADPFRHCLGISQERPALP